MSVPAVQRYGGAVLLTGPALTLTAAALGRAARLAAHGGPQHRLPDDQIASMMALARTLMAAAQDSSPTRTSEFASASTVTTSNGGHNYVSTAEASARTGLGQRHIQNLCRRFAQTGDARRVGRSWLISADALDHYMAERKLKEHTDFD